MAFKYDLKPLSFAAVSGFSQQGTVVPANFIRCFYEMVLDNIHAANNDLVLYDTSDSGVLLRLRLASGGKFTKTSEDLEKAPPVIAPLHETAYLGVVTTGPCNMSFEYAEEEARGVQ